MWMCMFRSMQLEGSKRERERERERARERERQTDRQTDRQIDRETERQRKMQSEWFTFIVLCPPLSCQFSFNLLSSLLSFLVSLYLLSLPLIHFSILSCPPSLLSSLSSLLYLSFLSSCCFLVLPTLSILSSCIFLHASAVFSSYSLPSLLSPHSITFIQIIRGIVQLIE